MSSKKIGEINTKNNYGNNVLLFDLSYILLWHSIISGDKIFHNFLENSDEFVIKHQSVFKTIQYLNRKPITSLHKINDHCHYVTGNHEKRFDSVLKERIKKYQDDDPQKANERFNQLVKGEKKMQLCVDNSVRLMGIINEEGLFTVLFIDYYHLIYPNQSHNQKHNPNNEFCPGTFRK